jgi:DNA-binding CsgD family transcriptional regulator
MSDPRQLFQCVEHLYESVLDDASWPKAMRAMAQFAGSSSTFYITANTVTATIAASECSGIDPCVNQQYLEYYAAKEVRLAPALAFPVGQPMTDETLLDKHTYRNSEIFRDLLQPHDVPHVMAVWVAKGLTAASIFAFERTQHMGTFDRGDVQRCLAVVPHLVRALNARESLRAMRQQRNIYAELLDRLSFGTLLLDESLRVIETSPAARRILDAATTLVFSEGRIQATSFADDARLQRALSHAAAYRRDYAVPGDSLSLLAPNGGRVNVVVLPVVSPELFTPLTPVVLVLLFDPSTARLPASSKLQGALGLTDAEARLASALFTGITLRESAERLHLSINTCKTQLKAIYSKLGCRNHVDLAKCLAMAGALDCT